MLVLGGIFKEEIYSIRLPVQNMSKSVENFSFIIK